MSGSSDILELFKQQQEDERIKRFLELKGCSNPNDDAFGLNLWTSKLTPRISKSEEKKLEGNISRPDHLVSFLAIPSSWHEDILEKNLFNIHDWILAYGWHAVPGLDKPFPQNRAQACSEGLLLPRWVQSSDIESLEAYLLIRRDGVVECGLGREAYFRYEEDTVFRFIHIVGRFWQYLYFLDELYKEFFTSYPEEILLIINIRGTEKALLGDLADGWIEPHLNSFETFRPKCPDKHLQYRRKISFIIVEKEFDDIVHWFALRIDNAWGQFEPRCYVSRKLDEAQPFARRKSK